MGVASMFENLEEKRLENRREQRALNTNAKIDPELLDWEALGITGKNTSDLVLIKDFR